MHPLGRELTLVLVTRQQEAFNALAEEPFDVPIENVQPLLSIESLNDEIQRIHSLLEELDQSIITPALTVERATLFEDLDRAEALIADLQQGGDDTETSETFIRTQGITLATAVVSSDLPSNNSPAADLQLSYEQRNQTSVSTTHHQSINQSVSQSSRSSQHHNLDHSNNNTNKEERERLAGLILKSVSELKLAKSQLNSWSVDHPVHQAHAATIADCKRKIIDLKQQVGQLCESAIAESGFEIDMHVADWPEIWRLESLVARNQFNLGKSRRSYANDNMRSEILLEIEALGSSIIAEELFSEVFLSCRHKDCSWSIKFVYARKHGNYRVTQVIPHSPCCSVCSQPTVNGYVWISDINGLFPGDRQFIERLAPKFDPSTILHLLIEKHTDKLVRYEPDLISGIKQRFMDKHYGGPGGFTNFLEAGEAIKAVGGVFRVQYDRAGNFVRAIFQPVGLKPYALLFGDYVQVDGTFCVCIDKKILIVFIVIDSLGHSVPVGFAIVESENSNVS